MNDLQKKEVDERFDKLIDNDVRKWKGRRLYIDWDKIKSFIHSEIERAEAEAMTKKYNYDKRRERIEGAKELAEKSISKIDSGYVDSEGAGWVDGCIENIKQALAEMEKSKSVIK